MYNWSYTVRCACIILRTSENKVYAPYSDRAFSARNQQKGVYALYGCSTDRVNRTRGHKGRIGIAYNTGAYACMTYMHGWSGCLHFSWDVIAWLSCMSIFQGKKLFSKQCQCGKRERSLQIPEMCLISLKNILITIPIDLLKEWKCSNI